MNTFKVLVNNLWVMLMSTLRVLVNNPVKESFYRKKKSN